MQLAKITKGNPKVETGEIIFKKTEAGSHFYSLVTSTGQIYILALAPSEVAYMSKHVRSELRSAFRPKHKQTRSVNGKNSRKPRKKVASVRGRH